MQKDEVILAKCSPELKAELVAFGERFGINESQLVRMAVQEYLDAHENADELKIRTRTAHVQTESPVGSLESALETGAAVSEDRARSAAARKARAAAKSKSAGAKA